MSTFVFVGLGLILLFNFIVVMVRNQYVLVKTRSHPQEVHASPAWIDELSGGTAVTIPFIMKLRVLTRLMHGPEPIHKMAVK